MKKIFALLLIFVVTGASVKGFAEDEHPRREQLNRRERRDRRAVNQAEKSGQISAAQAQSDRQQLNAERGNQRADVRANGGYVTKGQQRNLNRSLGAEQNTLKGQEAANAAAGAPAPTSAAPAPAPAPTGN